MPIRRAAIADADSIAIAHVMARRETYAGILSARYLAGQRVAEHAERWRGFLSSPDRREAHFVATDPAGNIVGFGACGPQRHPAAPFDGEIYGLYVLRRAQHAGLGGGLMGAMARHLADGGARSLVVEIARDN
ncbi:MAG: GNAT family N-acetyltransferase [Dongiaceae bacterium]